MGLKEDMKEMYRRLGVMDERVRQLQNLDIPKKGDIAKDLGTAKDQKVFDKKKKEWQTKLDKADTGLKDADSSFDSFTDQIKRVQTTNNGLYQDNTILNGIDFQIKVAEDNDNILKKAGLPSDFGKILDQLNKQRQEFIDKRKQLYNEVKQETAAMFKLFEDAWAKYTTVKRGDLANEKDALKNAKFGSGAKVKAGR